MKAVVIGASAGLGRALAEQLAARGDALVLVARDARDLEALAADYRLRFGASVHVMAADIVDPDFATLRDAIAAALGRIDALFMIAGITDRSDHGVMADAALDVVAQANFVGPVRVINALLDLCGPQSHIVAAGSIAAIRPRGTNVVYGGAKLGLEHYVMAIRHAYGDRLCSVCCYRLGYIKTAMTFGQKFPLPPATPEQVADVMIRRLGRSGVVYYPAWWGLVAFCLRRVPWFIFKKLRF